MHLAPAMVIRAPFCVFSSYRTYKIFLLYFAQRKQKGVLKYGPETLATRYLEALQTRGCASEFYAEDEAETLK